MIASRIAQPATTRSARSLPMQGRPDLSSRLIRDSIRLTELEGEPMIVREQGSTTRRAFEAALAATGTKPRLVMEIGSREAIREAVIHGLGISYVSEAEFVPDENLKLIPIAGAEVYTYAHVVVLKQRESSRIIKAFLDVVHRARDAFDAGRS